MAKLSSRVYVPSADSADNVEIADVVGNKTDRESGNSLYSMTHTIEEHLHNAACVYPTLGAGVDVLGGAAWVLGSFVEIIPASTVTSAFDIHFVNIEALSATDTFEIVLYAATTEIGRIRVTKDANQSGLQSTPIITAIQPPNTQIQAKCASSSGADTATISLSYHTY